MNLYRAGVGQLGPVAMPAAQAERIREISRAVDALDIAVAERATLMPEDTKHSWGLWKAEWERWRDDWRAFAKRTDWVDRAFGSTATQIENYARAFCQWAKQLRERWGGELIAPTLLQSCPAAREPGFFTKVGHGVAVAVVSGIIVTALFALAGRK